MISDSYRISSSIKREKSAANCDINTFSKSFHDFYQKVRMGSFPDLPHKICDPYGFFLICKDVKTFDFDETKEFKKCRDVFDNKSSSAKNIPYFGAFSFRQLLNLLGRGYYFDYQLALDIYNMQHDALNIFEQIMNGQGYVMNKMKPNKREVGRLMNFASDSQITLNEEGIIKIPYLHRVCDGKSWPCIISKSFNFAQIVRADTAGFGEGLFLINEDNKIIDVLRINDLWLTDTPLENRLTFASSCRNYEVLPYMKAFSWRSAIKAAKILDCTKDLGVLVRPCYENYYNTSWFNWSKNSLIYACLIQGELKNQNRKSSKPKFYTLEGDEGEINPSEERVFERIWLDDFDIKEFQRVLKLKEKNL